MYILEKQLWTVSQFPYDFLQRNLYETLTLPEMWVPRNLDIEK